MNGIINYFRGTARIRISGVEPQRCLNRFTKMGIGFFDIMQEDAYHLCCTIFRADYETAQSLVQMGMCEVTCLQLHGFCHQFSGLRYRPVLLLSVLLAVVTWIVCPCYIWTIEVQGNETIPTQKIVQELAEIGIHFGTKVSSLDQQTVKNQMLLRIPELKWMAVNCSGGMATVLVSERSMPAQVVSRDMVTNLVASRDGVIVDMSILNGFPVCTVGQAVKTGDLLVSGYADWVLTTQATRSLGEVYAMTRRRICAELPSKVTKKEQTGPTKHCIYLNFGRKRIKIFGNSGILVHDCDKIVNVKQLTFPGGYQLPLGLTVETYRPYQPVQEQLPEQCSYDILRDAICRQIKSDMIAGEILEMSEQTGADTDVYKLTVTAWCREMIARSEATNILTNEEERHGTDHQRGADGASH